MYRIIYNIFSYIYMYVYLFTVQIKYMWIAMLATFRFQNVKQQF